MIGLSVITDPVKAVKDHALKFWATKDFAERLAFSRLTWFLHVMYCFVFIVMIDTFLIIAVNDMFTLINFYDKDDFWLYNLIEEVYVNIHPLVEIAILYFLLSPKIIRTTLIISKAYSNKEKAFFEWIEFKIKVRFPSYKTSTQKARERLDKPKKKGKLNLRYEKYLATKNDVERMLIRGSLWLVYTAFLGSMVFIMLSSTSDTFNRLLGEETLEETVDEAELIIEQARPERPTSLPPTTIYDIFINKPITVIP